MNRSLIEYKFNLKDCLIGVLIATTYIVLVYGLLSFN